MNAEIRPGQEQVISPERTRLSLAQTAAVAGGPFAGKDSLIDILVERHGMPVYDGKGEFERRTGTEASRMRNDLQKQKLFDASQLQDFLELNRSGAKLYQTRLSGIILAEARDIRAREIQKNQKERQTNPLLEPIEGIPAVSVLLYARPEVRVNRALIVAMRDWEDKMENLKEGIKPPVKPTRESVRAQIKRNQLKDVLDWSRIRQHRNFISRGKDPFDPNLRRKHGGIVYDWRIDTSDKTPEEVADQFEKEGAAFGLFLPTQQPVKVFQFDEDTERRIKELGLPHPQNPKEVEEMEDRMAASERPDSGGRFPNGSLDPKI